MAAVSLRAFRDVRSGDVDIETAPPGMLLVIATGDPYRVGVADETIRSAVGGFVVGPQSRYGWSALTGTAEGVQVDLSWSAAALIFGADLRDLADRAVVISDLIGGDGLADRMSETPVEQRARLVGAWLRDRSKLHRGPAPLALHALRRIEGGVSSVTELAAELGCSRGHLHRTVHALTGQSPSTLMRIVRLHRLLEPRFGETLADVAAAGGYADHAHLCHETRQLAGRTPTELFGRRDHPEVT